MRVLFAVMLIFGVMIVPKLAMPQIGNPQGSFACVSIASKCSGRNPYVECGGNRVCKSLAGCGWRCQGGLLDITVAI